jgi:phenylalanyl-tRNA synthetase beta chain
MPMILLLNRFYYMICMKETRSPKGRKSITLRIIYRSAEKTLEDTDVTPVTEKIAKNLLDKLNASLPG